MPLPKPSSTRLIIENEKRAVGTPDRVGELQHGSTARGMHHRRRGPRKADRLARDVCIALAVRAVSDRFNLFETGPRSEARAGERAGRRACCPKLGHALRA